MRELQVTITHTPAVTTAIERYVLGEPHIRNGGRKKKEYKLYNTEDCEQAGEIKRCSIANRKLIFKGIIHAKGKKRFLVGGGLERPTVMKFKSRKIIDFLSKPSSKLLSRFESPHGFTLTALLSDASIDELEAFADAENEHLNLERLEKLQYI